MKITRLLSSIFRSVGFFFSSGYLPDSGSCFPIILFEVLPQRLSLSALEAMTNHVALLQKAGLLVAVDISTEQIPDGYIGKMSVWNEGLSECPKHWLLPQGYFDRTQLACL
ncbi:hypothetical protein DW254_10915 [Bacteroides caccae]|nr:hypothetical protein DW254_10915 [Bacteroides caccae]